MRKLGKPKEPPLESGEDESEMDEALERLRQAKMSSRVVDLGDDDMRTLPDMMREKHVKKKNRGQE